MVVVCDRKRASGGGDTLEDLMGARDRAKYVLDFFTHKNIASGIARARKLLDTIGARIEDLNAGQQQATGSGEAGQKSDSLFQMAIEFVELIGRKKSLMELDIDNYLNGRDIDSIRQQGQQAEGLSRAKFRELFRNMVLEMKNKPTQAQKDFLDRKASSLWKGLVPSAFRKRILDGDRDEEAERFLWKADSKDYMADLRKGNGEVSIMRKPGRRPMLRLRKNLVA